tara:strand:- start:6989 stop:7333 length:345 start_codon:yes stop_codon:yes gene_type:complete
MGTVVSEALRAIRKAKGIRQSELARTIGMDPGHLSRIESGQSNPNIATLTEIARALDLEIMLVPREKVPAVRAITAQPKSTKGLTLEEVSHLAERFVGSLASPAYRLDEEGDDE